MTIVFIILVAFTDIKICETWFVNHSETRQKRERERERETVKNVRIIREEIKEKKNAMLKRRGKRRNTEFSLVSYKILEEIKVDLFQTKKGK